MAFIRRLAASAPMLDRTSAHCQFRGATLRVLTTTYRFDRRGRKLDDLRDIGRQEGPPSVYAQGSTRLHAQAMVLLSALGFSTRL